MGDHRGASLFTKATTRWTQPLTPSHKSLGQAPPTWSDQKCPCRQTRRVEEETSDDTVTEFDEQMDEQMDTSQTGGRAFAFEFIIEARLHFTKLHRGEGVRRLS